MGLTPVSGGKFRNCLGCYPAGKLKQALHVSGPNLFPQPDVEGIARAWGARPSGNGTNPIRAARGQHRTNTAGVRMTGAQAERREPLIGHRLNARKSGHHQVAPGLKEVSWSSPFSKLSRRPGSGCGRGLFPALPRKALRHDRVPVLTGSLAHSPDFCARRRTGNSASSTVTKRADVDTALALSRAAAESR